MIVIGLPTNKTIIAADFSTASGQYRAVSGVET
jgi:hypothetical protein